MMKCLYGESDWIREVHLSELTSELTMSGSVETRYAATIT